MTEERNNTEQELNSQAEEEAVEEVFAENEASEQTEDIPAQEEGQQDPMEQKIAELEGKLEEADNRYLRLQADFDNFRRRSRIELEASAKYRAQNIITDLLPAIDNFERALKMDVDNEQAKSLKQGVEMVYRSLLDALKNEGVEVIDAVGKEFDPHLHQAVMQAEDENYGPNIVVEEFQKGYILKDRIIRPAMVKVNQ
ncbi:MULTISPECIES: nucleotide exchange factor GrpE [Bacillaceae]|uniref:nucleotide exchange factor GrpE n=1 Tax=Bacillaceae TaxID=186817 RepID=UPI0011A6C5C2|nr:nucleotide exchange factor GrpE [Cytobacillus oceanisediminis]MCM3122470.1 nucleotide exchange factor GrpE [Mesobacillus sp. MER 33]MCM3232434.1 nucleotide exchange factor GrpE [Mesobacillus sp. MER 48]